MVENLISRRVLLHFCATGTICLGAGVMKAKAETSGAGQSFAVTTPVHVRSVTLRVRDIATMTDFYHRIIGLDILSSSSDESVLGKDGQALLTLLAAPLSVPDDRVSAGLYHTAFLMPSRQALGQWLLYAYQNGAPFTGFADHLVSEATYLDDPEGNGIEVYADRSPMDWKWDGSHIVMGTEALDLDRLVRDGGGEPPLPYSAPSGLRIGHVHLRVGDVERAEQFYMRAAGLDQTARLRNAATFLANGRYHHHVGANIWQSRGAGQRDDRMAGLENVVFATEARLMDGLRARLSETGFDFREDGDTVEALDPWGTKVRFEPG